MTMNGFLIAASTLLYLGFGLVGWALNFCARRSKRYYPAIAHAGTAIGILPTYLVLLRGLRAAGLHTGGAWTLFTLCLVCAAALGLGLAALVFVVGAIREERRAGEGVGHGNP